MTTKADIEKLLNDIQTKLNAKQQELATLREEGIKLLGKLELLKEQETTPK